MSEPLSVIALVEAARQGDQQAWNHLVARYAPLVWSVIGKFRMSDEDAQDVSQTLWLRLVEHLGDLREARAVPAWIVTTTRNESLRVLAARRKSVSVDPQAGTGLDTDPDTTDLDEALLRAERLQALRDGLAELRPHHRDLLEVMMIDPPLSYEQISQRLGIPVGSIGPTRARALEQLRTTPALQGILDNQLETRSRR